jgi:hypothetical protein
MISLTVSTRTFTEKLRKYAELTGKSLRAVVKEQALLLAQKLVKLTYPASASQGKNAVSRDIGRVYVKNEWFENVFSFRNKALGDRIKSLVYAKDEGGLRDIFQRSSRLDLIRIEPFDASLHERMRRNGRVVVPNPRSFPVSQQAGVKALVRKKQRNVGIAKAGWAVAVQLLGKGVPAWLNKSGGGTVSDHSAEPHSPFVTLTNRVPWFAALDAKANIVSRALDGRASAMISSAKRQLDRAAKEAGL